MTKERNYCSVGSLFPFAAGFIDESLGCVDKRDVTRMSMLDTEMMNKMLLDQSGSAWVEKELVRLRSEIQKLKSVVRKRFAPQRSSGLVKLTFHPLNRIVEDS